jgi:excisionase family DNA binding protein
VKELLTVDDVSDLLGLSPATIRAWLLRRKNLPFVRCGRAIRIPAKAVEKFIKENTIPISAAAEKAPLRSARMN